MEHRKFKDKVYSYLKGDLKGRDLEEFEIHYFNCLDCNEYLLMNILAFQEIKEFISLSNLSELEDTLAINSILNDINLKNKISLKVRFKSLIDRLNQLVTERFIPCATLSLDGVRGGGRKIETYKIDDPLIFQLDIPADMDGYLTILHYDEENNLKLIFPKKKADNTHVKAGEEKWIEMKANAPVGKHYLKAILTSKRIIEPNEIDFTNSVDIVVTIEKLIESINEITTDEWKESVTEFDVVKA